MTKLYFRDNDDERCYLKKDIIKGMKEHGISELKIFEAKRTTGAGYFWCIVNQDVEEVGQSCGRFCSQYKPRNGKNERCRFLSNCYEKSDIAIIIKSE